jgi:hypothetical protein
MKARDPADLEVCATIRYDRHNADSGTFPKGQKTYRSFFSAIFFGGKFHAIMGLRGIQKKRIAKPSLFCRGRGQKLQFGPFFWEKIVQGETFHAQTDFLRCWRRACNMLSRS